MHAWQFISEEDEMLDISMHGITARMAVPGGWIYRHLMPPHGHDAPGAVAMVFVPTPATAESTHQRKKSPRR